MSTAALFKEDENWKQRPIFFVRKSLSEAETRYTHLEQEALALRVVAKKLCPYFQAHPIIVLSNLILRSIIHKPNLLGRMALWAIELSESAIQYKPRLKLKGVDTSLLFSINSLTENEIKQLQLVDPEYGWRFETVGSRTVTTT